MRSKQIADKIKIGLFLTFLLSMITGCKKLVDVAAPITSINSSNVYNSDATASAVLTGIYAKMSYDNNNYTSGGILSLSLFTDLSADALALYPGSSNTALNLYYTNALGSNVAGVEFWIDFYQVIFVTNASIEGLTNSTGLTPAVKQKLLGEAKFIRAFCYLYLVNLYGDLPLALSTNYKANSLLARSPKSQVYKQIISDLTEAESLLDSNYVDATILNTTIKRTRPNKWAATALLARAYLYSGDWGNAEAKATAVINNTGQYSLLNKLNSVFLSNSSEAIWQLQPVKADVTNTQDAYFYIIPSAGPDPVIHPVYLSSFLLNAFETSDLRRIKWVDSVKLNNIAYYYPYKYEINTIGAPVSEYEMVLRLAEQYLIRSESRAEQGNLAGAQADLNVIRNRAGLPNTGAADQTSLLAAILHERQVELFTEWGHRWIDLKRTNSVDATMKSVTPKKGGNWNINWQWYPIPVSDLQRDINLTQNQDY